MIGKRQERADGPLVSVRAIQRFARRIVEKFQPEKIILFGSYTYGQPHADSDVDLLVVMAGRNQLDQAGKIYLEIPAPFPVDVDVIVRTPKNLNERLARGDLFTTEIVSKGKILYEAVHAGVGAKSVSVRQSHLAGRGNIGAKGGASWPDVPMLQNKTAGLT